LPDRNSEREEERLYTVAEVASHFKVDTTTVRRWANEGSLAAVRLPGGGYRFKESAVQAFDPNFGK